MCQEKGCYTVFPMKNQRCYNSAMQKPNEREILLDVTFDEVYINITCAGK